MAIVLRRTSSTFRLIALRGHAAEVVHAPSEFHAGFRCALILPTQWANEWLIEQVETLLQDGAKLFYFFGNDSSEAARLTEAIVINMNLLDIAVGCNESDIVDFLWKFRLVYDPDPVYDSALDTYLIIRGSVTDFGNWRSILDEVFPAEG